MKALFLKSLIAAILLGPASGFVSQLSTIRGGIKFEPPLSDTEPSSDGKSHRKRNGSHPEQEESKDDSVGLAEGFDSPFVFLEAGCVQRHCAKFGRISWMRLCGMDGSEASAATSACHLIVEKFRLRSLTGDDPDWKPLSALASLANLLIQMDYLGFYLAEKTSLRRPAPPFLPH